MFKTSLAESGVTPEETFMCVLAPGWLEHSIYNEYYKTTRSTSSPSPTRCARVQGDRRRRLHPAARRPGPAGHLRHDRADTRRSRSTASSPRSASTRRTTRSRASPPDRVRYHICWGSWHGPHTHDLAAEARRRPHAARSTRRPTRSKRPTRATSTSGRCGRTSSCRRARSSSPASSATPATSSSTRSWWRTASCSTPARRQRERDRRHGLRHGRPRPPADRLGQAQGAGRRRGDGVEAALLDRGRADGQTGRRADGQTGRRADGQTGRGV